MTTSLWGFHALLARDIAEWEAKRRERMILNLQRQAQRLDLELVPAT